MRTDNHYKGPRPEFYERSRVDKAFADYWRNRNRVMRDRLVPIEQRRDEIKLRSVQHAT